ncbi:MAG: AMP-binding protein [Caldilineaceae bacterium]
MVTPAAYAGAVDIFRFFHALGVNLKQVYGQTETSGLSVIHRDGAIKFQTVGTALPGTEVKIADNGEILRPAAVFHAATSTTRLPMAEALQMAGSIRAMPAILMKMHLIVIDRASDG